MIIPENAFTAGTSAKNNAGILLFHNCRALDYFRIFIAMMRTPEALTSASISS